MPFTFGQDPVPDSTRAANSKELDLFAEFELELETQNFVEFELENI